MKITGIQAIPLHIPQKLRYALSSSFSTASSDCVLVKVFTDEGITGYGEVFRFKPVAISAFVDEVLKPILVGQNPMHVEMLWDLMYRTTFRYGRKGITLHCISGVEIALWDIIGKYRQLPVFEMIGGACRDKLRAYASLPRYENPHDTASDAVRCVEEGYTAVKLHQTDIESLKLTRKEVGDNVVIMVDINGHWAPREAVEKIKEMADYNVLWIEEPVSPMDDYDGLSFVRERSTVRIAAGENEYTHYGFKQMITQRAVDILQPDIIKAGGIGVCRKILALAEAWNIQLIPHSFYFGPGVAATLHFATSSMSSDYVEINAVPLEAFPIEPTLRPVNGFLKVPDGPGLGIEIDEAVVKKYPYA
jgi:D-arabinonate dehydratase